MMSTEIQGIFCLQDRDPDLNRIRVVSKGLLNMELKKAIEVLISELNSDDGYRYGWQANIAMAFSDACAQEGIQFPQLHNISNNAAKQFLHNLCRENN